MRSVREGKKKLVNATKSSIDTMIDVLSRPIDVDVDADKLKAAIDGRSQSIKSVQSSLLFVDESDGGKEFIEEKVKNLIAACWICFDTITDSVMPKVVDVDLEDNRMKNAIISKDVGRDTCGEILVLIEQMQEMLDSGEIVLKKHHYTSKTIESRATSIT